jgi:5-methyltetrahydrofolate--homocysteine methyltransferase
VAEARANRLVIDWTRHRPLPPRQPGLHVLENYPLADLVDTIDWTPFFQTWELAGRYPDILQDPVVGEAASSLYQDACEMLDTIVRERWLEARAVFGLYPAAANGDDVLLYADESREVVLETLLFLRQQRAKAEGRANRCLADYVAPAGAERATDSVQDWVGLFAVTAGLGIERKLEEFEAAHDDYRSILLKALADRLAEAFAEYLHQRVRTDLWGYAADEQLGRDELIREKYRGTRPAPGYPACPDHSLKPILFELLGGEAGAGISLTENFAMLPASAVSGFYFAHPQSQYFGVARIGRDQLEDYAARRGADMESTERWLRPNLD